MPLCPVCAHPYAIVMPVPLYILLAFPPPSPCSSMYIPILYNLSWDPSFVLVLTHSCHFSMPGSPTSFVPAASFTVQYWAVPHCPTCLNDMLASGHLISIKKIRKINSGEISLQKKETKAGVEPKTFRIQCATKEPLPLSQQTFTPNSLRQFI